MKKDKTWVVPREQTLKSNISINSVEPEVSIKETKINVISPEEEKPVNKGYFVTVKTLLNIRRGPGLEFDKVGFIFDEKKHYIFEEQNGFGRIGDDQWIMLEYTQRV